MGSSSEPTRSHRSHPDERLLHQVLRVRGVVGDEQESPEQPFALGLEEVLERERDPKVFCGSSHCDTLLLHRLMNALEAPYA